MEDVPITPELIKDHGLSEDEYEKILEILGREPNITELGIFSVMWSEHCSYKSSRIHLKNLPTSGKNVLQGPGENAGVIDIGEGLAVVFKIESHNHPSFIEPYQGAATGVGGILRDIFTMGARPIASLNSLRFGPLSIPKNRYLLGGVVSGIAGYGNCIGVPTVGGEIQFHETYNGNPLVNVFNLGIARADRIFLGRARGEGNPVIYVGSKTGRDGIHGATMASEEFDETSEERRPTVQVGDPFCEKLLLEACLELFKKDILVGIQDMGAAGLTCSTCEMASRGGTGIEIDISLVPRREEKMTPYEVMLSESQERMLMVVRKGHEDEAAEIFSRWDLEAATIGRVTGDGMLLVKDSGRTVARIPAHPLAEEAPIYDRPKSRPDYIDRLLKLEPPSVPPIEESGPILKSLLAAPSIAGKEWVWQQYDHMVRINTITLPGSDAAVIRVPDSHKALALSVDGKGLLCYVDPYTGGAAAVAEAARNVACAGARPLGITNCLNFGNPEKPEVIWQFSEVVRGMGEACRILETPVTGGNVSFYNETLGVAVLPTPVVGMVGLIDEADRKLEQWFQNDGDEIILLGLTVPGLGGSDYLKRIHNFEGSPPPAIDLQLEKRLIELLLELKTAGLINSAHDVSDGGMAVALAEACLTRPGSPIGADIALSDKALRTDTLLFGESFSRITVSCPPGRSSEIISMAEKGHVHAEAIGKVGGANLRIRLSGETKTLCLDEAVSELRRIWSSSFNRLLNP